MEHAASVLSLHPIRNIFTRVHDVVVALSSGAQLICLLAMDMSAGTCGRASASSSNAGPDSERLRPGPRTAAESDRWAERFFDLVDAAGQGPLLRKNLESTFTLVTDYSGQAWSKAC